MPEGVGYGPQFTASTGLTLNYINKFAYAHSGSIDVDNNLTNLLDFTTGGSVMVATIQNFYAGISSGSQPNPNVQFQTKFNGEVVTSYVTFDSATDNAVKNQIRVIIPPYTKVELTGINAETSATIQLLSIVTAQIYGKVD